MSPNTSVRPDSSRSLKSSSVPPVRSACRGAMNESTPYTVGFDPPARTMTASGRKRERRPSSRSAQPGPEEKAAKKVRTSSAMAARSASTSRSHDSSAVTGLRYDSADRCKHASALARRMVEETLPGGARAPAGALLRSGEQFVEQRPVAQQGLAHVLGGGLIPPRAVVQVVCDPVVLHDVRMVDRHQLGLLGEVVHRIPLRAHHLPHQPVGFDDRTGRSVDEARLKLPPLLDVAKPGRLREWRDGELCALLPTVAQVGFGRPAAVPVVDGALVLRPELLSQRGAASSACGGVQRERQHDENDRYDDQDPDPRSHERVSNRVYGLRVAVPRREGEITEITQRDRCGYRLSEVSSANRCSLAGLRTAKTRLIRPPSNAKPITVSTLPSSRTRAPGAPLSMTGSITATGATRANPPSRLTIFFAPTTGCRTAVTTPPPSAIRTASGARVSIRPWRSPVCRAARNRATASCCSMRSTSTRGRRAATCDRARWATWRTAADVFPVAAAISSNGSSKTSCSTNTARSVGVRVSSTVSIAIDTLSASSTSSATSGVVSSGSGSHSPTYSSLRRASVRSRFSASRLTMRTR